MSARRTVTISNIAGGDARTFPWTGEISGRAIRHANRCEQAFGGALWQGEGADDAHEQYQQIREDREREIG